MPRHLSVPPSARRVAASRAHRPAPRPPRPDVPDGVRVAGGWAWRILAVSAVLALVLFLVVTLRVIAIPFFVAIVLSALLVPFADFLMRHRWPKWLAVTTAEVGVLVAAALLLTLVVTQVGSALSAVVDQSTDFVAQARDALLALPLGLSAGDLDGFADSALTWLQNDADEILTGVASFGAGLGEVLTGTVLALFATLFILIDGRAIWAWFTRLFPRRARPRLDHAGRAGWVTLGSFVKVQILVALIDAVGIGAAAALLGVPLAVPIAVLVFLGSFIPVIGAIATGAIAVFIALVYNGWVIALAMLAAVLIVQQVESHVLQPLIMGNAVKVHPLAVIFAVAGGSVLAGIAGAFFAVPVVATLNAMILAANDHARGSASAVDRR